MKKQAIGVFLGGLTLFIWGAVSWMILPLNEASIQALPQEQLISDTLKTVVKTPGVYLFPSGKTPDGQMGDRNEWAEKYKMGPIGFLVYSPNGTEPMSPRKFAIGLVLNLLISAVAFILLSLSRDRVRGVMGRAGVVLVLGLGAWLSVHASYWNWFNFPFGYTLTTLFDTVVAFTLLGIVISKFVPE